MTLDANKVRGAVVIAVLIGVCVVMRLVEHAPNFTPLAATAIFAGFFFRSRMLALTVPIAALAISDLLGAGFYDARIMIAVYACIAVPALVGRFVRGRWMPVRVLGASLAASVLFFAVTNFAHFLFTPMYEKSLAGLLECYTLALPFFRNTLLGDLSWSFLFFGAYAVLPMAWLAMRARTQKALA